MSLVTKCKGCGNEVSSEIDKCPNCGRSLTADRLLESQGYKAALGIFQIAIVIGLIYAFWPSGDNGQKPTDTEKVKLGFHCLSSWNGSHRQVIEKTKSLLNDPDSFEHVETKITPVDVSGRHRLIMKYRAKNPFGALVLAQASAIIDNKTCDVIELDVE